MIASAKRMTTVILASLLIAMFTPGMLSILLAQAEPQPIQNYCCVPAHIMAPTMPPGASTDCQFQGQNCVSIANKCQGVAWLGAVAGACRIESNKVCIPNAVTTNVTIYRGTWGCKIVADQCKCEFTLDNPLVDDNVQVSDCGGDSCS